MGCSQIIVCENARRSLALCSYSDALEAIWFGGGSSRGQTFSYRRRRRALNYISSPPADTIGSEFTLGERAHNENKHLANAPCCDKFFHTPLISHFGRICCFLFRHFSG